MKLFGEAEVGSAGKQPAEEYPNQRSHLPRLCKKPGGLFIKQDDSVVMPKKIHRRVAGDVASTVRFF